MLGFYCGIHQLALSRKSIIFGFPNFWSAITRLSHLFEVETFRTQFRAAVVQEICNAHQYIPVSTLPEQSPSWRDNSNIEKTILSSTTVLEDAAAPQETVTNRKLASRHFKTCRHYSVLFTHGFAIAFLGGSTHMKQ